MTSLSAQAGEVTPGATPANVDLAIKAFTKALAADHVEVRKEAAVALSDFGPAAAKAAPALVEALRDDRLHWAAGVALESIGTAAIPALADALRDKNGAVRRRAAIVLGRIDPTSDDAVPALVEVLAQDCEPRLVGGPAIAEMTAAAAQALEKECTQAVDALVSIGPAAVPALIEALRDEDSAVRKHAALTLGLIALTREDLVSGLSWSLLNQDNDFLRQVAIFLRRIATPDDLIDALVAALTDENSEVRWMAAFFLGHIDPTSEEAVAVLVAALSEEESELRAAAASALGSIDPNSEEAVAALVAALSDEESEVRATAASALGSIAPNSEEAVAALVAALSDEESEVRAAAASALGSIAPNSEEAVAALIAARHDEDSEVRREAAIALDEVGPTAAEAVPALVHALKDEEVGRQAAAALASIGPAAVRALIEALRHKDVAIRRRAASALGSIDPVPEEAVAALVAALSDEESEVRATAASALGSIDPAPEEAVTALIAALRDDDNDVRRKATIALGSIDPTPQEAVAALIAALRDDDNEVRHRAAIALGSIDPTPQEAVAALIAALRDQGCEPRWGGPTAEEVGPVEYNGICWQAAAALESIGPAAEPALVEFLGDEDSEVRQQAASALGSVDPASDEVVAALIAALRDEDSEVRLRAANALGKIGPPAAEAVPPLIAALKAKDGQVSAAAAIALGQIGPVVESVIPELIQAADEANRDTLDAIVAALNLIGAPAEDALHAGLKGSDPNSRRIALKVFRQMTSSRAAHRLTTHGSIVARDSAPPMSEDPIAEPQDNDQLQEYYIVPVFYATDRQGTGSEQPSHFFGSGRGNLSYGLAQVSIPLVHEKAKLESPSFWRFEVVENPARHVLLLAVDPLDRESFFNSLRSELAAFTKRQALVFVHGFNVTFNDAARRTAQLAHDLSFQGIPILYSWPSKGRTSGYFADEETVHWTKTHLANFLRSIADETGAEVIHLVAHSMGNRALVEALEDVGIAQNADGISIFNNIILTAPDIDADIFRDVIARQIEGKTQDVMRCLDNQDIRVTLYASSNDKALQISKALHETPRAGEAGDRLVVVDGIDTIDVSYVDTNIGGHSYYADNRSVISDMFYLLRHNMCPADRADLKGPQYLNGLPYWIFKP